MPADFYLFDTYKKDIDKVNQEPPHYDLQLLRKDIQESVYVVHIATTAHAIKPSSQLQRNLTELNLPRRWALFPSKIVYFKTSQND